MVVGHVLNLTQCIHISPFMDLVCPTTQALVPNPFILAWLRPASARLSGLISGRDDDGVCE